MSSRVLAMILVFPSLLSFLDFTSAADTKYRYHVCQNTTTFARNSTYQSNLNLLLSSLPTNAGSSHGFSTGFYNATAGQDPNKVYALFLCRGDVSATTCQDCVNFATSDVIQRCPFEKQAVIWYDECLLRYSNQSIFSSVAVDPNHMRLDPNNITDATRASGLLLNLMNYTVTEAVNSPKKFAARKGVSTTISPFYSLVQCTPDLSSSDCTRCLHRAIADLPTEQIGAQTLFPSCFSRYELYAFYNESVTAAPSPGSVTRPKGKTSATIIAIVAPVVVSAVLFIVGYCLIIRGARKKDNALLEENAGNDITTVEFLQFDLRTIEVATNRFSVDNKLGEGGFGDVYKGFLPNGQEIAVKRLSRSSRQGAEEFKNEVAVVAKLQHRNLVRLLGLCSEREEKILVYEFVPNKSLDSYLCSPRKQGQLDWSTRYKIIGRIARGLLYLHEDSCFRIIHRDLKPNNILLDMDMNPKISDFGMAKIFGIDQTQGDTSRIVGTYGYMAPEYAMHGHFSVKSDVYSFGVLVLEIITGKKNNNINQTDGAEDLLSYAWKQWRDGTPLQLLDSTLADSYSRNEVIRCIHIGLLCVQEDPAARPTMATVVLTLDSYSVTLPVPHEPAFSLGRTREELDMPIKEIDSSDKSMSKSMPCSVDDVSITEVCPR